MYGACNDTLTFELVTLKGQIQVHLGFKPLSGKGS